MWQLGSTALRSPASGVKAIAVEASDHRGPTVFSSTPPILTDSSYIDCLVTVCDLSTQLLLFCPVQFAKGIHVPRCSPHVFMTSNFGEDSFHLPSFQWSLYVLYSQGESSALCNDEEASYCVQRCHILAFSEKKDHRSDKAILCQWITTASLGWPQNGGPSSFPSCPLNDSGGILTGP